MILTSLPFEVSKKVFTVVVREALSYFRIRFIVVAHALTGQRISCFDRCWVIVAIFSPFFCDTNVIDTHSAWSRAVRLDP